MINLLNNIANVWAPNFALAIVQNTLFLGLIFLTLHLLKNADARIKYNICLLGIIKLMIPPFLPAPSYRFFSTAQAFSGQVGAGSITVLSIDTPALQTLSFFSYILLLWIFVFTGLLLLTIISTLTLQSRLAGAQKIGDTGKISLYTSEHISSPLIVGLFPRKIYLPVWWAQLNKNSQESLLNHELAHLERKDGVVKFLQTVIQALYFFHPLVWLLNERVNEYREMACDDLAVQLSQVTPNSYSSDLLHIAENLVKPQWNYVSASALVQRKHKILNRITYQLQEGAMQKTNNKKTRITTIVLAMLIIPFSWYCGQDNSTALNQAIAVETGQQSSSVTGKIWGKVTDAKTGSPIPGVNVSIADTDIGAATDKDGIYYINNVTEGTYNLEFAMMGFASVMFKDVVVEPKTSTKLDCKMERVVMKADELSPPPPPPLVDDAEFVDFDTPPTPVDGFAAIQKNLIYPEIARKAGIEGRVVLNCLIDKNGEITETKIMNSLGDNGCDEAAIAAIKAVKWKPATKDNKPVDVWISVPITFSLH